MFAPPPRVSRSPIPPEACRLAQAIDMLGDRWALLILRSALYGVRRFDDFRAELQCPRTVLSGRLKRLEAEGILAKVAYREPGKRARHEYVLTDQGAALQTALVALNQWGDEWRAEPGAPPPLTFTDSATRQRVRVAFVDDSGAEIPAGRLRPRLRSA
ncbi:MAG: helix-turn-helix domain-containing protein [Pseudomonadota bacterium]